MNTRTDLPSEGEHIRFTQLQFENFHRHFRWNNDPELNRLDSEIPHEKESYGEFKKRFEKMVYNPSPANQDFEIHLQSGELIGVAYLAGISQHNKHCLIGITIGEREHWGKGYGRESLRLLLDYCFNTVEMHRVCAETFEYNEAWRHLVEDAGFVKEGTERDYLYRDGEFWDKEVYSLLEDEYAALREKEQIA